MSYQFKKLVIAQFILLSISISVKAQDADYSGIWVLNPQKTDYGKLAKWATPVKMEISQTGDSMTIKRYSKTKDDADFSYVEKLAFDGTPCLNTLNGGTQKSATLTWSDDEKVLNEEAIYTADSGDKQRGAETWKLSDNDRTLTVARLLERGDGSFSLESVYEKK